MRQKIGILVLTMLVVSMFIPSALACTRTPGYWKNPKKDRITVGLEIGEVPYDTGDLMDVLRTPVRGSVWNNLAQKVIAMKLSIAILTGGYAEPFIITLLDDAEAWLKQYDTTVRPNSPEGQAGLALAGQLDYWLNFWDEG